MGGPRKDQELVFDIRPVVAACRKERLRRGITQREVARRMGRVASQVSGLECTDRHATVDMLARYAEACGMHFNIRLARKDSDGSQHEQ